MENRKGSGIFLGVIGVATLIVAIIGATFAFFGANAASNETAIGVNSAVLQLGYTDNGDGLKYNLIPAADYLAEFAGMNEEEWYGEDETKRCIDENGNEICAIYEFTIGNPSFTTQQNLFGNIKVAPGVEGETFENLYFAIYQDGVEVMEPTAFSSASEEGIIELSGLAENLIPSSSDKSNGSFDSEDPDTYTKVCKNALTDAETFAPDAIPENQACNYSNKQTYEILLWIHEIGSDQTSVDSGKVFAAGLNFTSAKGVQGVTGIISAAQAYAPAG